MSRRTVSAWLVALALIVIPTVSQAFWLDFIPYSGRLAEDGTPVNGTRYFTVNLYDVASGGSPLATVFSDSLPVTDGIYHALLPTVLGHWSAPNRWFGVAINSGPEQVPRLPVGSVPFAMRAHQADSVVTAPGVAFTYVTFITPVPNDTWVAISSLALNCPADGFAIVTADVVILDDSNPRSVGQLSIGAPGSAPLRRFALTTGSGGTTELPISHTKVIPVVAGSNVIVVYARNTDNFFGSFSVMSHSLVAQYVPKYLGP